jgi:hypothetical protein
LKNTPTVPTGTVWNDFPTYNATTVDARMTIIPNGNIGIANANPVARLHITEATGTTNGA